MTETTQKTETYSPQQTKIINKASIEAAEKMTDAILSYQKVVDTDTLMHYHEAMGKLPYIDESGELNYLDPLKIIFKSDVLIGSLKGISPRLLRAIARHRPEVEAILQGKE
jgi:hypothetical protein